MVPGRRSARAAPAGRTGSARPAACAAPPSGSGNGAAASAGACRRTSWWRRASGAVLQSTAPRSALFIQLETGMVVRTNWLDFFFRKSRCLLAAHDAHVVLL